MQVQFQKRTFMADENINNLNNSEKEKLESIITIYGLSFSVRTMSREPVILQKLILIITQKILKQPKMKYDLIPYKTKYLISIVKKKSNMEKNAKDYLYFQFKLS